MISLSNRIVFDISSRLSCVVLNTAPYASKASISTSNFLEAQVPGIPKRPSNPFIRFANEVRPEISKKNPNLKMVEITKIITHQYKELPVDRKEAYNEAYKIEKKKYDEDFERFKNSSQGKELLDKKEQDKKEKMLKKYKSELKNLKTDMGRPKRYPLAINLFSTEKMTGMSGKVTENIKIITQKWGALSEAEKAPYFKESEKLKEKYEKDLAAWEASQGKEAKDKIEVLQKKITEQRNTVKGIEPTPKVKKVEKTKAASEKKVAKKTTTKATSEKKVTKKATTKATSEKKDVKK